MDYNAFLIEMVEKLIASIPQLVAVLTMVGLSLSNLKKTTNMFPDNLFKTEQKLTNSFDDLDNKVQTSLDNFQSKTDKMLDEAFAKITSNVTNVMGRMETELKTYREQLQVVKSQMNLLIKENRALVDVIIGLIAKNPELVKNGISSQVADMLNMTQQELIDYSSQMIDSLPLLESVLKEALVNFDMEDIDAILGGLGYERKDTETTS
jgi:hypothetical protein